MNIKYAFFGSSQFSIFILDELVCAGFIPACIVTTPDKPQGRKLVITPNVVKTWAIKKNIPVLTPEKLDNSLIEEIKTITPECNLFIVASYGKIIPQNIIDWPENKTLNVHPSLLPKYRGASPLQTAILEDDKNTGVTIMQIDEKMDHGPIVAQKTVAINEWPTYEIFEEKMASEGGKFLAQILPDWVTGKIKTKEQDHNSATYTKKITKEEAFIDLSAEPYTNFRKIQAYHQWPQAYFIHKHNGKEIKVKITSASFQQNKLIIEKVIPEGSKEISYSDFLSGYRK